MKNSLSLILLLAMTTLAFAQGKLALSNDTDNLIYFTSGALDSRGFGFG